MAESHKVHEGYSSKKPVPKVALRSILDPSGATEAKAKHLFKDKKHEDDGQQETISNARDMVKGKEVRVTVSTPSLRACECCTHLQLPIGPSDRRRRSKMIIETRSLVPFIEEVLTDDKTRR